MGMLKNIILKIWSFREFYVDFVKAREAICW